MVVEFLHGRHVSTSSRSSSGPDLRIQILHKLTHKMQVAIPVVFSVVDSAAGELFVNFVWAYLGITWLARHRLLK